MALFGPEPQRVASPAMVQAFERLSNGVTTLVREHLELARVELKQGARTWSREGSLLLGGAALVGAGYLLLMVALALGLGLLLSPVLGFLLVGLGNAGVGAGLVGWRLRRLSALPRESALAAELARDAALPAQLRSGPTPRA